MNDSSAVGTYVGGEPPTFVPPPVPAPPATTSLTFLTLFEALAAFQGEVQNPVKNKKGIVAGKEGRSGYSYGYADLAEILDAVRPVLAKHGLFVVQVLNTEGNGSLWLKTILGHKSGEWLASEVMVHANPNAILLQAVGGAITYMKRYTLTALLGIQGEDDQDAPDIRQTERRADAPARSNGPPRSGPPRSSGPPPHQGTGEAPPAVSSAPRPAGSGTLEDGVSKRLGIGFMKEIRQAADGQALLNIRQKIANQASNLSREHFDEVLRELAIQQTRIGPGDAKLLLADDPIDGFIASIANATTVEELADAWAKAEPTYQDVDTWPGDRTKIEEAYNKKSVQLGR